MEDFKISEIQYFEEKIHQIEKNVSELIIRTYDHTLTVDQLKRLRRQIQQSIGIYNYGLTNDKFEFLALPSLKTTLDQKMAASIQNLKNSLEIVSTKLSDTLVPRAVSRSKPRQKKKRPEDLRQIWEGDEISYNKVISFLQEMSPTTGCAFLNNRLEWLKVRNSIKYLAAFTQVCILKEYIRPIYSAPDFQRIYLTTFNIQFNIKPFQALTAQDLSKYADPFKNMP